jgi:hypothetical protein
LQSRKIEIVTPPIESWDSAAVLNREDCEFVSLSHTQEALRIAIVTCIEGTFHRRRRKISLGKKTPVECKVTHEVVDQELLFA